MPLKVLFIGPYPEEGASGRYRMLQYFEYFRKNGIDPVFSPFMSERFYRIRRDNKILEKTWYFMLAFLKRLGELFTARNYDVVFIHRETFPLGPPVFEWAFGRFNQHMIYDIDDAVFAVPTAKIDQRAFLKDEKKYDKILSYANAVIVGGNYLCEWARIKNPNTKLIPTCVYVFGFKQKIHTEQERPVIGWIGNWGNAQYILLISEALSELAKKKRFILKLVGGADIYDIKIPGLDIQYKLWSLKDEEDDILSFDIGIMPLIGTQYDLGKCAFKIIQYASRGIPAVASAIGENLNVVEHGRSGYLAKTILEWEKYLGEFISDSALRNEMGKNAHSKILEFFNADKTQKEILDLIMQVAGGQK